MGVSPRVEAAIGCPLTRGLTATVRLATRGLTAAVRPATRGLTAAVRITPTRTAPTTGPRCLRSPRLRGPRSPSGSSSSTASVSDPDRSSNRAKTLSKAEVGSWCVGAELDDTLLDADQSWATSAFRHPTSEDSNAAWNTRQDFGSLSVPFARHGCRRAAWHYGGASVAAITSIDRRGRGRSRGPVRGPARSADRWIANCRLPIVD